MKSTFPSSLAAIAVVLGLTLSAQAALYIDFEPPAYTTGLLIGQEGWTTTPGYEGHQNYVTATDPLAGTQSAFVYAAGYGNASYSLGSESFEDGTTFSILMSTVDPADNPGHGFTYAQGVAVLRNTDGANYLGLLAENDGVFRYLNVGGTGWENTSLFFSYGDILSITATLDFTAQTYDLVATNLTTSSTLALSSLGFVTATSALQASGMFSFGGQSASFDNVSIQPVPEPSTNVLLGLTAVGLGGVLIRRRNQVLRA